MRRPVRHSGTPVLCEVDGAINRDVPILMAHGTQDPMVRLAWGDASRHALVDNGYQVEWRTYPMQHQVMPAEIADIARWLALRLG